MEKNTSDQHCSEWSVWHQFSVIQNINRNVGLKCFLFVYQKCFFDIIVIYSYFINISQGSVETHLWCGEIYDKRIIANCMQNVLGLVKEFWKSVNMVTGEDMDKSKMTRFYGPPCILDHVCWEFECFSSAMTNFRHMPALLSILYVSMVI